MAPRKGQLARESNPNWKGGRTVASNGYVLIKMPEHPAADSRGYVYEHRVVAEQKIGRSLRTGEEVHHINGIKTDNRDENLEVMSSKAHHRLVDRTVGFARRLPGEPNEAIPCRCGCGESLDRFDRYGRPRAFVTGHNMQRR